MACAKDVLKSEGVRSVLCWLGAQYIRFVYWTTRWQVIGQDAPKELWARDEPFILTFWHNRLLMMPFCWNRKKSFNMLISSHRDGVIISSIVRRFGISTTVGSSSKGGGPALRVLVKLLKSGYSVGITPDGPRGPRMHAKNGAIATAKLSGRAIMPITYAIASGWHMNSWDHFFVPRPFSKGVILWGEPIYIAQDQSKSDMEDLRLDLEEKLTSLSRRADEMMGREPVEPAPLPSSEVSS